ncbi:MAG: cyclic nucleotide-binding domain-containing protein [Candidatus Nitrohelix vancouverensis]|uniref:Cyclic nucleotide-binding domain-containing protein n=1 Tax=Candidatus Nitrohelix vancouverensis TaxID=2705534 RepID=A0A7T0C3D1_9BACT|nr:MAG: cyclic nucleotide-binding domain-containing protein [Candidatus Nitrohelix vancouverensis]
MSGTEILKWMDESSFFDAFTIDEKVQLLEHSLEFFRYRKGDKVIKKGHADQSVYLILRGSVNVESFQNRRDFVIATLKEGSLFGELSLLREGTRLFNVIARDSVVVMKVDVKRYEAMPHNLQLKFNDKFLEIMLERFEEMNETYAELLDSRRKEEG